MPDDDESLIRQLFLGWWCSLHYYVLGDNPTIEEEIDAFIDLGQRVENINAAT
jgi:hypothetical protein